MKKCLLCVALGFGSFVASAGTAAYAGPAPPDGRDVRAETTALSTNAPIDDKRIHEIIGKILVSPQRINHFFGSDEPKTADSPDISMIELVRFVEAMKSRSIQESAAGRPQIALRLIALIIELTQKMANLKAPATVAESQIPGALSMLGSFAQENAIGVVKVGIEDVGRSLNGLPKPMNERFKGTHHVVYTLGTNINALQKQQGAASRKAGVMTFVKKPSEYSASERESIQEFSAIVAQEMSALQSGSAELRSQFAKESAAATKVH